MKRYLSRILIAGLKRKIKEVTENYKGALFTDDVFAKINGEISCILEDKKFKSLIGDYEISRPLETQCMIKIGLSDYEEPIKMTVDFEITGKKSSQE